MTKQTETKTTRTTGRIRATEIRATCEVWNEIKGIIETGAASSNSGAARLILADDELIGNLAAEVAVDRSDIMRAAREISTGFLTDRL